MKKVLFYIPSLSPAGGIERVLSTIANKLSDNYDVTILTKDGCDPFYTLSKSVKLRSLNIPLVLDMNSKFKRIISYGINTIASIRKLRSFFCSDEVYDYIYITHPTSHLELICANVDFNKIVISEHGAASNYNVVYRAIKNLTYRRCHAYCVPTKMDFELYRKYGYPVVYTPHYKPILKYKTVDFNSRVVLNIGRFTPDKNQLELIRIWASISEEIREGWVLKIIGTGELVQELQNFIVSNGLSSSILIEPPMKNVEDVYASASIFALTSRSEGFGMVLLEAAGFGLPLIAFNCPSGPRDIINNENGYLIPEGNIQLYKERLSQMMMDSELKIRLGIGAKHFSDGWSDDYITEIWRRVFS
ncbi:glycosyltransferase family 4 protein [Aeromonas rivipollensis]|uniref:glycosyltransferase family 4 protein n=1 Tax=Aeromonas rivipollensis TaxID=948519 RepID=UPI0038D146C8